MKFRGLILTAIILFLLVNTTYYWAAKIGHFAIPLAAILAIIYIGLLFALIKYIYIGIKEKFTNKDRSITIGIVSIVLVLIFYKPFGLINFDKLEGDDLLIAQREGVANCMTTFTLKDNFTFRENIVCFGRTETNGTYRISNDTIYFKRIDTDKKEAIEYDYGLIVEIASYTENKFALQLYNNNKEPVGPSYFIEKNELKIKPVIIPNQ